MPNIKSNKKNLRKTVKRTSDNKSMISRIRTQSKKVIKMIQDKQLDNIDKEMSIFFKYTDKGVKKGVLKKNNAARKKSDISKKVSDFRKQEIQT